MALTDKLTSLADAVREKTGTSATMTIEEMTSAVRDMSSGENLDTEMATQDNLIEQIQAALVGKAIGGGSGAFEPCEVTIRAGVADRAEFTIYGTTVDELGNPVNHDYISTYSSGTHKFLLAKNSVFLIEVTEDGSGLCTPELVVDDSSESCWLAVNDGYIGAFMLIGGNANVELSISVVNSGWQ